MASSRREAPIPVAGSGFRPEIEGLRAVAIGLVLLFHAGVPVLTGGFVGVDVFFVISGFLITSHILREIERSGRLRLFSFWGRRMKRLLPAALTVFIATAIAVWAIAPVTSWRSAGADIAAASLYVVNWRFAEQAVDYNAEGAGVSPVLHFWSLAVEEQFYLVWPVMLGFAAWVVLRGRPGRARRVVSVLLACVCVPSLVWSLVYTGANPDGAFFVTTTRLWELGAGAAVAVGADLWPRIGGALAAVLGWGGGVAIVVAALAFDEATPWPGAAALLPVLGTAAVIVATTGRDPSWPNAGRLLTPGPLVWVGGLSYSWYLWHWPVLVLAEAQWGDLRLRVKLLLVLCSGVLAWASLRLIENPVRRSRRLASDAGKMISFGVNLSLLGLVAGLVLVLAVPSAGAPGAQAGAERPGARALEVGTDGRVADYQPSEALGDAVPLPADATTDLPQAQRDGCVVQNGETEVVVCEYGDPEGDLEVALVGDSKALQWQPAIGRIGEQRGWRVTTYLKSACAFAEPAYELRGVQRTECAAWNRGALEQLTRARPNVVVTSGRHVFGGTREGDVTPGAEMIAGWWAELEEAGIRVVPLLDNPAPDVEVYECAGEHPEELSRCAFDRDAGVASSGARYQLPAAEIAGVTTIVDVSDITCPASGRCPAVIGGVLVYRQGSHLTNTFVESAAPLLAERLVPAVESG